MMKRLFPILFFLTFLNVNVAASGLFEDGAIEFPCKLISYAVSPGDVIQENQLLCTVEVMKMQINIYSTSAGTIGQFSANVGDILEAGMKLISFLGPNSAPSAPVSEPASAPSFDGLKLAGHDGTPPLNWGEKGNLVEAPQADAAPLPAVASGPAHKITQDHLSNALAFIESLEDPELATQSADDFGFEEIALLALLRNPPSGPTPPSGGGGKGEIHTSSVDDSLEMKSHSLAQHKSGFTEQEQAQESFLQGFARYVYLTLFHPEVGFLVSLIVMLFSVPSLIQSLSPSITRPVLGFVRAATLKV